MKIKILILFIILLFFTRKDVIAYDRPDFNGSSLVATKTYSDRVPADGLTEAIMTVTLVDANGNALAGETVSVTAPYDSQAVIHPERTNLDGSGKAIFYVRSTTQGITSLDVINRSQNVTLSSLGHVTFYSTTCTDAMPSGSPKITSATAVSNTQIKLTWTKAADPVSFYTVYYGLTKGAYIYGNPNVGGANTTSYTVGSLNPGTTYYFIVISGNGCTLGPISNEVSAKAVLATDAPSPTPTKKPTEVSSPIPTTLVEKNNQIAPTATPQNVGAESDNNEGLKKAIIISFVGILILTASVILFVRRK